MINNQAGLNDQFNPRLCVDETNGLIVVTYHDTVADTGRKKTHVYYQTSSDDGATWSTAVQVTTSPSDATGGAVDPNGFSYGDYDGLSGNAGTFFPCWTDLRNGIEEIWTARLSLIPKQASFVMDRSSFGQDEVNAMLAAGEPVRGLAGLLRHRRRLHARRARHHRRRPERRARAPCRRSTRHRRPSGITIGAPTQLVADDPSLPAGVAQRFTWLYPISITNDADFTAPLVNVAPHRLDRRRHRQRDPRAAAGAQPVRDRRRRPSGSRPTCASSRSRTASRSSAQP